MTINDLLDALVEPRSSGCGSRQSYEHCVSGKYNNPDCRKKGKPDHCWFLAHFVPFYAFDMLI